MKLFVPDAEAADYTVVVARSRGEGEEGVTLFLVKGRPKGMTVKPLETLDMTRRWSEVRFDAVQLNADAVMGGPDKGWPALKRALEWATAALCAELRPRCVVVLAPGTPHSRLRSFSGALN